MFLKCGLIIGSLVYGVRESILYSFGLDKPPAHKIHKNRRIKVLKRIILSVLFHNTIYLVDGDHKLVGFNGETLSLTCQLVRIYFLHF